MSCCEEDHECEECCLCTDESETRCDGCEKFTPWEDLSTADDGETWFCPACQPVGGEQ